MKNFRTHDDEKFEKQVDEIIERLMNPSASSDEVVTHRFKSDLNARQRRIVHEKAEKTALYHVSQGPENARFITISTKPIEVSSVQEEEKKETAVELKEEAKPPVSSNLQVGELDKEKAESVDEEPKPIEVKNNFESLTVESDVSSSK